MSTTSSLYKLARLSATAKTIEKGRGGQRLVNITIGRATGKAGLWRLLWRR